MRWRLVSSAVFAWTIAIFAATAGRGYAENPPNSADGQEIGVRVGLVMGGQTTPGGLHLGGLYLYQLSELDWFEGGVGFSYGGDGAACFRDRTNQFVCDHGAADGFAGGLSVGVRRFLVGRQRFTPFVHGGIALRYISFSSDEVQGIGLPLWMGGGVRATVVDNLAISGSARYQPGLARLNRDLGWQTQAALAIFIGVDFGLD